MAACGFRRFLSIRCATPRATSSSNFGTNRTQVLDPRVAFVMTNMLEGVINFGTAYGVRSRGFTAPAAGKTGTSHDGWFAGYTSNLLCIVWVGYDDYSDIRLSGAQTAAPIWAEFMKKAVALPQYADVKPFTQPQGVVDVQLDKITNRLATPSCPGRLHHRLRCRHRTARHLRPEQGASKGSSPAYLVEIPRKRCLRRPPTGTRRRPPVSNLRGRGAEEEEPLRQNCGRVQGRWQRPSKK